jgi:hypothetical protein
VLLPDYFQVCPASGSQRPGSVIRLRLKGNPDYVLKNRERWMELCALAVDEQDPAKLISLINEINRLLEEKQNRLRGKVSDVPAD